MYQGIERPADSSTAVLDRPPPGIRAELNQQRRFRIDQLEELTADAGEAATADDGHRLQVTHILLATAESALDEIDAAMQRLEEGSYGICEGCGEPIPWERLEVLPMSRLCTTCQYVAESGRSTACTVARSGPAVGSADREHDHDHELHHRRTGRLSGLRGRSSVGDRVCPRYWEGPVCSPCLGLADRAQRLGNQVRHPAVRSEGGVAEPYWRGMDRVFGDTDSSQGLGAPVRSRGRGRCLGAAQCPRRLAGHRDP